MTMLRHADGRPYLSRLVMELPGGWSVRLHRFHSSDGPHPHDHPWPFVALSVWGFGIEEIWWRDRARGMAWAVRQRRILPFVPRFYCAFAVHRVLWPRQLVTVVVTGRRIRTWGFWLPSGVRRRGRSVHGRRWVRHSDHVR